MKPRKKEKLPLISCAILAILSVAAFIFVSNSMGGTNSALRHELMMAQETLLTANINLAENHEIMEQEHRAAIVLHTNLDLNRVERDNQLALTYFTPAFSWQSGAEYDAARAIFVSDLGETHPFIKTFMPPNGTIDRFNYIDLHALNSELISFETQVTNIHGETYQYIAIVTMATRGHLRNTGTLGPLSDQGFAVVILMYTVDDYGAIGNLSAWPTF